MCSRKKSVSRSLPVEGSQHLREQSPPPDNTNVRDEGEDEDDTATEDTSAVCPRQYDFTRCVAGNLDTRIFSSWSAVTIHPSLGSTRIAVMLEVGCWSRKRWFAVGPVAELLALGSALAAAAGGSPSRDMQYTSANLSAMRRYSLLAPVSAALLLPLPPFRTRSETLTIDIADAFLGTSNTDTCSYDAA